MMLLVQIALLLVCLGTMKVGGGPEKIAAIILVAIFLIKVISHYFGEDISYYHVSYFNVATSVFAMVVSMTLAVFANRIWPIFFAAFSVVQVFGHLSAYVMVNGQSRAYWAFTQIPVVFQVLIISIGAVFFLRRTASGLMAPDWRDRADI